MNKVYIDPISNIVVVAEAWKGLALAVNMSRRRCYLHCVTKSPLYAFPEDEEFSGRPITKDWAI